MENRGFTGEGTSSPRTLAQALPISLPHAPPCPQRHQKKTKRGGIAAPTFLWRPQLTNGVEDLGYLVVQLGRGFHEQQAFALCKLFSFLKEKVHAFNGSLSKGMWLTHKKWEYTYNPSTQEDEVEGL